MHVSLSGMSRERSLRSYGFSTLQNIEEEIEDAVVEAIGEPV